MIIKHEAPKNMIAKVTISTTTGIQIALTIDIERKKFEKLNMCLHKIDTLSWKAKTNSFRLQWEDGRKKYHFFCSLKIKGLASQK